MLRLLISFIYLVILHFTLVNLIFVVENKLIAFGAYIYLNTFFHIFIFMRLCARSCSRS